MLGYITLVGLMALVGGQPPKYCCMAPQWESSNTIIDARIVGTSDVTITTGTEKVSVDDNAHLVASSSNLTVGGVPVSLRIIQDFNNTKMYTIQGSVCRVSTLAPWKPKCVPDEAKLLTSTYYGLQANKVNVDIYGLQAGANTVYLNIAKADCAPMYVSGYGSQHGTSAMSVKTYGNVTLGIKDRSVFIIPDICRHGLVYNSGTVEATSLF